ncbi:DNA-binding response regulator [Clostridium saccharoperbutylacetonicum]|uniref:DNA-binding response regulator n=1 Tax=Clostridium saccharoperbutylacetonicum TaxID=36745 RepID=UPI0039ECB0AA
MYKIDKEKVKELYLEKGCNIHEIATKMQVKEDSVKKCIERNFKQYKLQHKRIRFKKKEIEKSINYEATKCMSDSIFIKRNPSIYRTTENGDIIVNAPEETLAWDVPRELRNENSKDLVEKRLMKKYKNIKIQR